MTQDDYLSRIHSDPNIRFGKPVIRGTRIAFVDVMGYLAAGETQETLLADFPQLTVEDIRACFAFAADRDGYIKLAA